MKLVIPIKSGDKVYTNAEVTKPRSGVIADSNRERDINPYSALKVFVAGSVVALSNESGEIVESPEQIKLISNDIPYQTAEQILYEVFKIISPDTGVEGIYPCPRCKTKIASVLDEESESDTRDFIEDLEINHMGEYQGTFTFNLSEAIILTDARGNELEDVPPITNMTFKYTTLKHCITAYQIAGGKDIGELNFQTYIQMLEMVNGEPIDKKFKSRYGMMIFRNVPDPKDLIELPSRMTEFGVDNRVEKRCNSCGKRWRVSIDTSNFFDMALRQS